MAEGFTRNHKFHPFGKIKNGVSEKEFSKESKDFIKVPKNHVFNKAIRDSQKKLKL